MLDNLMNPDLSGVTGSIHYVYDNSLEVMPDFIIAIGVVAVLVCLVVMFNKLINKSCINSPSEEYRNLLSDMYVVGRVKQIAEEDKIDLSSELKKFRSITEKNKANLRSIDEVIEMELKEKIQEDGTDSKPNKK